jgi:hypothetical protein
MMVNRGPNIHSYGKGYRGTKYAANQQQEWTDLPH